MNKCQEDALEKSADYIGEIRRKAKREIGRGGEIRSKAKRDRGGGVRRKANKEREGERRLRECSIKSDQLFDSYNMFSRSTISLNT